MVAVEKLEMHYDSDLRQELPSLLAKMENGQSIALATV